MLIKDLDTIKEKVSTLHVSTRAAILMDMDCGGDISIVSVGAPEDVDTLREKLNTLLNS